jgi:hypothetical protein
MNVVPLFPEKPWPPSGWKLARGEGPAKAEFEEHMRRAKAVADAWQQRPRGRR